MVREVGQCVCPMSLWNKLIWAVYGFKSHYLPGSSWCAIRKWLGWGRDFDLCLSTCRSRMRANCSMNVLSSYIYLPGSIHLLQPWGPAWWGKVTWENSVAGVYLMGGQRARSQSLWWLQETIGLWSHRPNQVNHLSKRRNRIANGRVPRQRSDEREGRAWERALGVVGKNRIQKLLSSVMAPSSFKLFFFKK